MLGVDASASPKDLKRAYLRKTKSVRPERDPEGFQRVREAYELLRPHHAGDVFVAEPPGPSPGEGLHSGQARSILESPPEPLGAVEPGDALERGTQPHPSEGFDSDEAFVFDAPAASLLELVADGRRAEAQELAERVGQQVEAAAGLPGEWRFVEQASLELARSRDGIPEPFARCMAWAVLDDDVGAASEELERLAQEHPFAVSEMVDLFATEAPALGRLFGEQLQHAASLADLSANPEHQRGNALISFAIGLVVFAGFIYLKCFVD